MFSGRSPIPDHEPEEFVVFRVSLPENNPNISSEEERTIMSAVIGLGSAAAGAAFSLLWALGALII
jgi:hypothetical protein